MARLARLALLTLLVALLAEARRTDLLVRLRISQTDTTTECGATEGALPRKPTRLSFSIFLKVANGEHGGAIRSTPSSLPQ